MNPGELEGSPRRLDQVMLAVGDAIALDPDHADGARAVAVAVGGLEIEGNEGGHAGRRAEHTLFGREMPATEGTSPGAPGRPRS